MVQVDVETHLGLESVSHFECNKMRQSHEVIVPQKKIMFKKP